MGQTNSSPSISPCSLPHVGKNVSIEHLTVLITGLSAKSDTKYDDIIQAYNQDPLNHHHGYKMIRCDNNKEISIVGNVVKSMCGVHLDPSDRYVFKMLKTLHEVMKKRIKLTIIGYSYGGSVVARIVELLAQDIYKNNIHFQYYIQNPDALRFFTFGSIYIPSQKTLFPITHYMFPHDWPALSCNHVAKNDKRIHWLPEPTFLQQETEIVARGIKVHTNYPIHIAIPRPKKSITKKRTR